MAFVLDASATLPWCFHDEANSGSEELLERARRKEKIFVPSHWPVEVMNGVTRAVRRGRVDDDSVERFMGFLLGYRIAVDEQSIAARWGDVKGLIRQHRLSAYDAAYLALAKRMGVPLATFDQQLRVAAAAEGVELSV